MDFKYKQLEQELSALSKVFSELGVRLSEVAKEVTATGVNPSEKLIEQIAASRASFESVRSTVHGHATAMLVSPLPKLGELVSIATIDSLFKAAAVAEESKFSIEAERQKAEAILGRVLSITHRETSDFKPLQECHAKIGELRNAVLNVAWPHRHPEAESIVEFKHPATDFLHFVENLAQIDDERWMALETTITNSFSKPLFVAASRGKLAVEHKPVAVEEPAAAKPAAAPEAAKPAVAVEKPVERRIIVEKAPEKPAPLPTVSAAPPAVSAEKKPTAPLAATLPVPAVTAPVADKAPQKPVVAQPPAPLATPAPAAPVQTTVVAPHEKKPAPPAVPAPTPAHPAAAASTPVVPQAATPVAPTPVTVPHSHAPAPPAAAVIATPAPPAHTPAMPLPAPTVSTHVPALPAAAASNATPPAAPAASVQSLSALATATELAEKKPASVPADAALDKQRKEPRLATPATQSVSKPESKPQEEPETMRQEAMQESLAGDGSQRPQRWGFWRGNR